MDLRCALALAPLLRNSKCKSHTLVAALPSFTGATKVHCREASSAWLAKYLLGPRSARLAWATLPWASTATRTRTFTVPRMVVRTLAGTSGITSCCTEPQPAATARGRDVLVVAGGGMTGEEEGWVTTVAEGCEGWDELCDSLIPMTSA